MNRLRVALIRRLTASDRVAEAEGWTVVHGRFGSRTYRDPRMDTLRAARITQEMPKPVAVG